MGARISGVRPLKAYLVNIIDNVFGFIINFDSLTLTYLGMRHNQQRQFFRIFQQKNFSCFPTFRWVNLESALTFLQFSSAYIFGALITL